MILCIDPGTDSSGAVSIDKTGNLIWAEPEIKNDTVMEVLDTTDAEIMLLEMVACYGMPVGRETFETCVWIGRFIERFGGPFAFIYRRDVKLTLCNSMRAKDANVRQAIIDRYNPVGGGKIPQIGTKNEPGPLYGVSKHAWSALAVGWTWLLTKKGN